MATRQRITRGDCGVLARAVSARGHAVRGRSEPTPPLSRCLLRGPGTKVSVYLDTAFAAPRRYGNRMVEQAQFGAPDPRRVPHSVPGVGDPAAGEHNASWVPAYSTLFAVRGNRWLTVAYSVEGESGRRRLVEAARLARLGFRLTAR